ncbi:SDR family oxidoreductase [Streptomyces morookaense]|uniref:SDR family oxidoreductase n=1 Tax=Streptomyces morookaense TaxID=1970 RepID=UPI0033FC8413
MGNLDGKTAVVTGGSRGIGRAVVQRLASDGATVVFSYATDERAAKAVEAGSPRARAVRADMANLADIQRLFSSADEYFTDAGPGKVLDILVNNAGISSAAPVSEVSEADYDRVMAVNAKGPFFVLQHAATRMRTGGTVINVSTLGTVWPSPGEALYAASKAALEQFTRIASREFGHRGIRVNTVSPGPTDTDMLRAAVPAETFDNVARMTALGRLGRPADIANVVAFLAGPDAGWLTGQNIHADGGLT